MTTTETTYNRADPIRCDELHDQVLRIENLVRAAEMLADATPDLRNLGAPPIIYLLEMALADLDKLGRRVST